MVLFRTSQCQWHPPPTPTPQFSTLWTPMWFKIMVDNTVKNGAPPQTLHTYIHSAYSSQRGRQGQRRHSAATTLSGRGSGESKLLASCPRGTFISAKLMSGNALSDLAFLCRRWDPPDNNKSKMGKVLVVQAGAGLYHTSHTRLQIS